jgi:hypothetical protein
LASLRAAGVKPLGFPGSLLPDKRHHHGVDEF